MLNTRLLLLTDAPNHAGDTLAILTQQGFNEVDVISCDKMIMYALANSKTDVILLELHQPTLEIIQACRTQFDLPIILFSKVSNREFIEHAMNMGVTNFVEGHINSHRLQSILCVSMALFKKQTLLLEQLETVQNKLTDRKYIEKAKMLLMSNQQLSEQEAFQLLRQKAMSKRISIGQMSINLLIDNKLCNH